MTMKIVFTLLMVSIGVSSAAAQNQPQSNQVQQPASPALSESDQLLVAVQKICPVSGSELRLDGKGTHEAGTGQEAAMGPPVKVKIGDQEVFLCCQGCLGKTVVDEHWKKVQSNLAAAQGTCPIMGKPVTADMKSTIVNGRQVFVCCPPCIEKIQADVEGTLNKLTASYTSYVAKERQAASDEGHIAAQKICPVSGELLGSMGAPIKVKVGEDQHAFLCCKGCIGKQLSPEHWKTIQTNLATAQGTCPVMGKKVDASMKSVVVNGRKVFACCPPCIDKIKADPETYLAKLDTQVKANLELESRPDKVEQR